MYTQEKLREQIHFRLSPLLDLALSLLVLQSPERFGRVGPWADRVLGRLPAGVMDQLQEQGDRVDFFALVLDLEDGPPQPTPDRLRRLQAQDPALGTPLLAYWEALAPEVAAGAGLLAESLQQESARLAAMDPLAFMCRFSDRISVAGDGEAMILHWGKGMRVPLTDLERILFVPSAFCPRRLMFYRLGPVQIFFYPPGRDEPPLVAEAPESLVLGYSALADATRLKLLRLIARQTLPAQDMALRLGVNESTVSRHLRLLVEAGLVGRDRQEGKFIFYSLNPARLDELAAGGRAYLQGVDGDE